MNKALLFDLNGTIIDDMAFHHQVWDRILNEELGAGLSPDGVKQQLFGKNAELLERVFGKEHFSPEEIEVISARKERYYREMYKSYMQLIPGLGDFLEQAQQNRIPMAIGSAAIASNVDFVLDESGIRHYFEVIVCSEHVRTSKPDPEVFLKAADQLGVAAASCIVFEDVPKGVEAALNAGMKAVVITTTHRVAEFKAYPNILFFISDYTDPRLNDLIH